MRNANDMIKTSDDKVKIIHTSYNETNGMKKGCSVVRSLIKVYYDGEFLKEFTRNERNAFICLSIGGTRPDGGVGISLECKKSEGATKGTSAWSDRKKENYKCIIIESKF